MSTEVVCYSCHRPIELGAVLGHGQFHCSFECAAETGGRAWKGDQMLAIKTAVIPVRKMASKLPAHPMEANGAPSSRMTPRLRM